MAIGEPELAVELGLHRPHRRDHDDAVLGIRHSLDRFAARDARLQDFRVVKPSPYFRLRHGDQLFAGDFHGTFIPICGTQTLWADCRATLARSPRKLTPM